MRIGSQALEDFIISCHVLLHVPLLPSVLPVPPLPPTHYPLYSHTYYRYTHARTRARTRLTHTHLLSPARRLVRPGYGSRHCGTKATLSPRYQAGPNRIEETFFDDMFVRNDDKAISVAMRGARHCRPMGVVEGSTPTATKLSGSDANEQTKTRRKQIVIIIII
eukprot:GHVU01104755.1.p1 GENE.GHVU01104755.1~~GHVU01104755.1.p1  ORF type:complete len:164 (-),score=5.29 GHVU01104755.1:97-588(-)